VFLNILRNIAEQGKGTETKNCFYPIYYVILYYLLLLTFHEVQIIHFRQSIFYFIMHILACEYL